jgi:hypothetical protein
VALRIAPVPAPDPRQQMAGEQPDLEPEPASITTQAGNTTAKVGKKAVKKKLTAKEKRERGVTIHFLSLDEFWS